MGVNIVSQDGEKELFVGPYSGFGKFRTTIATALGCPSYEKYLEAIIEGMMPLMTETLDGIKKKLEAKRNIERYAPLRQSELQQLYVTKPYARSFLEHSDCDGNWTVEQCKEVRHVLTDVVDLLEDWQKEAAIEFIEGLDYCIEHNQEVIFT